MNSKLCTPIGLEELKQALREMANKNIPRLDGVTIEFFKAFWKVIDMDYHNMLYQYVALERLMASIL
jgi:hypothetical protein